MKYRIEHDSLGNVQVPLDKLYGAQTVRSMKNFCIGTERFTFEFIQAIVLVKKAAALANKDVKVLSAKKVDLIIRACDEILDGKWADQFPLSIWQTGSGTQTNMNVNEVLANRASSLAKDRMGRKNPIHPNDDVNRGQSSNDVFPTAMHVASVLAMKEKLVPAVLMLKEALTKKAREYKKMIKIGRTHLMDATPVTLGQEFSAYAQQLSFGLERVYASLKHLQELALGATAVGTGINTHPKFAKKAIAHISRLTSISFKSAPNPFAAIAAHEAMVEASDALKGLAVSLTKIANDIRFLSSGPRCGIGELVLPANEPGSSIMPGKVNPTQCEALLMVCSQVIGNNVTITLAGASGNFELNVQKPVMIYNFLQSVSLLSDACFSFAKRCVAGIKPNQKKIEEHLQESLMLVTALTPLIGYDKAALIAQKAHREGTTLRQAALETGFVSEKNFVKIVNARNMV
jgi:fumarate hydratase class II